MPNITPPPSVELYFRRQDQMVCGEYARRIAMDGMSLVIHGPHPVCVEHYAELLSARLRQFSEVSIEILPERGAEQVVQRFNQIVASMRMSEALDGNQRKGPARLLVCRGLLGESPGEWRMLMRLVRNFPGANVQLVLVQSGLGDGGWQETPEYFGKWMLRWAVPMPSAEQAAEILAGARKAGLLEQAEALLRRIDRGLVPTQTIPAITEQAVTGMPAPGQAPAAPVASGSPATASLSGTSAPGARAGRRITAGSLLTGLLVILIATFIMFILFPRHTQVLRNALLPGAAITVTPAADRTNGSPPTAPTPGAPSAGQQQHAGPVASPFPGTDMPAVAPESPTEPPTEAGMRPAQAGPATTGAASNLVFLSEPAAAVRPPLPPAPKPAAAATASESETKRLREAVRKIRAAGKQQYFIQFAALSSLTDAQAWVKEHVALRDALIAPVRNRDGIILFAVIAGPFSSNANAMAYSNRKGMPEVNWVRTAGSLWLSLREP